MDSSQHSASYDGADAVLEAIESNPSKTTREWQDAYELSPIYEQYVEKPLSTSRSDSRSAPERQSLPEAWRQFRTLCRRLWRIKTGEKAEVRQLLLQPLVIGLLIAVMTQPLNTGDFTQFVSRCGKCIFLLVITSIWFGCNNSVREIVGELAIYLRERTAGLSIRAYLFSKIVAFTAIVGAQTLVLFSVVYFAVQLPVTFFGGWGVLWFSAVVGASLGLFLSASAKTTQQAIQTVPLVLLPMIIFGGGVTRLQDLGSVDFLAELIPARWAFLTIVLLEKGTKGIIKGGKKETDLLHFYFEHLSKLQSLITRTDHVFGVDLGLSLGILVLMAAIFLVGAALQLKRKDIR
jgi:ABC-type multidrug transport system permease subunit